MFGLLIIFLIPFINCFLRNYYYDYYYHYYLFYYYSICLYHHHHHHQSISIFDFLSCFTQCPNFSGIILRYLARLAKENISLLFEGHINQPYV